MNTSAPESTTTRFPLLTINDQTIPWEQILTQLQLFGKLQPFLQETVSQHVLLQEINTRKDLTVTSTALIQEIVAFQQKNNLTDQQAFQAWLKSQNLDNARFQKQMVLGLKLKKLRQQIAEPGQQAYFESHQTDFGQLRLSCLFTSQESVANELKDRLSAGQDNFVQLANEYAADDRNVSVRYLTQQLQRRSLPANVRQPLASAAVGTLVGPVAVKSDWGIFRLEEVIPAELNDQLKLQIEKHLFGQWLADKTRNLNINFNVAPDPKTHQG